MAGDQALGATPEATREAPPVHPTVRTQTGPRGTEVFLAGRLEARTIGALWAEVQRSLGPDDVRAAAADARSVDVVLDASDVEYCDGAGVGLLIDVGRRMRRAGVGFELRNLPDEAAELLRLYDETSFDADLPAPRKGGAVEELGRSAVAMLADLREVLTYSGRVCVTCVTMTLHPSRVRWRDVARTMETAGVDALPIAALISLLMGVILAFQSAIPLKQFGADVFVADLVAISLVRELGPLMTAIVLIGRSGSAFAAEIGTMKVNEEVDALTTMGVDPVRFLVMPRGIAAVVATPLLTLFAMAAGLAGGAFVMHSFGYPLTIYVQRVSNAVHVDDLFGALFKSFVFGVLVAAVGCIRGLQTGSGAAAVGRSTTSAVVTGILLVVVVDMVFAVLYHYLGI